MAIKFYEKALKIKEDSIGDTATSNNNLDTVYKRKENIIQRLSFMRNH